VVVLLCGFSLLNMLLLPNEVTAEQLICCKPDIMHTNTHANTIQEGGCYVLRGVDFLECPIESCIDNPNGLICTPKKCSQASNCKSTTPDNQIE